MSMGGCICDVRLTQCAAKTGIVFQIQKETQSMANKMMKPKASYTARNLLLLLSLSMVQSCGGGDSTSVTDTAANTPQTTAAVTEASYLDQYDGVDFGGEDYTLAVVALTEYPNYAGEENTGEPVNDAQYARDTWIEEHYNVKIQYVPYTNGNGKMLGDVQKQV